MKRILSLALALVMMLAVVASASAKVEVAEHPVGGELIYGSTTELSGDWAFGAIWSNNAADKLVRDLIDDYGVVAFDQGGALVENKSVTEKLEEQVNDDGSKTFTVKIAEDLVFNNGDPITAEHFVAGVLLFNHPVLKDMGSKSTAYGDYVGGDDFHEGKTEKWSGVRLLDAYTFSLTVVPERLPYFYEKYYVAVSPLHILSWLGEGYGVKDDGDGCYFVGDMKKETIEEKVTAARYRSDNRVTAGPYTLVSFDKGTKQAVLEINKNYKGNFEGQKPSVQKLIITKAVSETQFDALKTGGVNFLDTITGGNEVNAALDLAKAGGYATVEFPRAGYGAIFFQCDFGPTQFQAVRHAVAHLFDRADFANTFCEGYGSLVNGPYGPAMWMYQEAEEELDEKLNAYEYDADKAVELLVEDGWVLNAEGGEYTEGIRYKKVTAEEAGDYALNVTLADGTILMPLIINWSSSEKNSVSELLVTKLANNPTVPAAGMEIRQNIMTFEELLNWYYREGTVDPKYNVPTYGMFNLASGFTPIYDQSKEVSNKPEFYDAKWNTFFLKDDMLADTAWDMVYTVPAGDNEGYLTKWVEYVVRWNELLPAIPLYSNIYYSVFVDSLKNYEQTAYWTFASAIVYAYME